MLHFKYSGKPPPTAIDLSVIPAFRKLRKEVSYEFKTNMSCVASSQSEMHSKTTYNDKQYPSQGSR